MEEVFENQTRLPGGQWIYMSDNYTDVVRGCSRGRWALLSWSPVNLGPGETCHSKKGGTFFLPCSHVPRLYALVTRGMV